MQQMGQTVVVVLLWALLVMQECGILCPLKLVWYGDGIEENYQLLPNPLVLLAVSKCMWAVKHCCNNILKFVTGVPANSAWCVSCPVSDIAGWSKKNRLDRNFSWRKSQLIPSWRSLRKRLHSMRPLLLRFAFELFSYLACSPLLIWFCYIGQN